MAIPNITYFDWAMACAILLLVWFGVIFIAEAVKGALDKMCKA